MDRMIESEEEDLNEENAEVELIEDIIEEFIEEEKIYDNPTEGLLVSNEFDSNNPKSDTDEDSVASTQHIYGNIDAKDSVEAK